MTLLEYANERDHVVLYYAGVGSPAGAMSPLGHEHIDFADRNGLLDLEGSINADGEWEWDGQGNPTDDSRNTIYLLRAYPSREDWENIDREFTSGD